MAATGLDTQAHNSPYFLWFFAFIIINNFFHLFSVGTGETKEERAARLRKNNKTVVAHDTSAIGLCPHMCAWFCDGEGGGDVVEQKVQREEVVEFLLVIW